MNRQFLLCQLTAFDEAQLPARPGIMVELSASKLSLVSSRNVSSVVDAMFLDFVVVIAAAPAVVVSLLRALLSARRWRSIRCQRCKPSDELAFHKLMCGCLLPDAAWHTRSDAIVASNTRKRNTPARLTPRAGWPTQNDARLGLRTFGNGGSCLRRRIDEDRRLQAAFT